MGRESLEKSDKPLKEALRESLGEPLGSEDSEPVFCQLTDGTIQEYSFKVTTDSEKEPEPPEFAKRFKDCEYLGTGTPYNKPPDLKIKPEILLP